MECIRRLLQADIKVRDYLQHQPWGKSIQDLELKLWPRRFWAVNRVLPGDGWYSVEITIGVPHRLLVYEQIQGKLFGHREMVFASDTCYPLKLGS